MVKIISKRNSTTVDERGLKHGLIRGHFETLEEFQKRIVKATANLDNSYDKFYRSLGYATELQDFEVFKITKTNESDKVVIDITDTRIVIEVNDTLIYKQRLENVKFLIDLKTELDQINEINTEIITTKEWQYLKTINILPSSSLRLRTDYDTFGNINVLPEEDVLSIQDSTFLLERNVDSDDLIIDHTTYYLEGNVLIKPSESTEKILIEYLDFPFVIRWCPIKSYTLSGKDREDLLKDRIKNSEQFGVIVETPSGLDNETVEILSQRGANIIKKVLEKQNTYWGE